MDAHIIDSRGVYLRTETVDPMGPQPAGAIYGVVLEAREGFTRMRIAGVWVQVPDADVPPLPEPAQPAIAPRTCTPAQGLVALFAVKQITEDDVHAGIAAISDPVERYTAQIGFKRATEWQEDSQTMQLVQAMLQLSAQDMRELFDYAQTVRV